MVKYQTYTSCIKDWLWLEICAKPDLLLAMTFNQEWPEIISLLASHQKSQDRFDIVTWLFHVKLQNMLKDIVSKKLFGATMAFSCQAA
jgi:Helitron helicase-like domain at N-terminus